MIYFARVVKPERKFYAPPAGGAVAAGGEAATAVQETAIPYSPWVFNQVLKQALFAFPIVRWLDNVSNKYAQYAQQAGNKVKHVVQNGCNAMQ